MPLFNHSPNLHPDSLSILFDRDFRQKTVCRKNIFFRKTGEQRIKIFIVVNANPFDPETLAVLAQSDPSYALNHPVLKTHLIFTDSENSDDIFRKPGYIDCTEIIPIPRAQILSEFLTDTSILVGALPEPLWREVYDTLIGSSLIEVEYQERIYNGS